MKKSPKIIGINYDIDYVEGLQASIVRMLNESARQQEEIKKLREVVHGLLGCLEMQIGRENMVMIIWPEIAKSVYEEWIAKAKEIAPEPPEKK